MALTAPYRVVIVDDERIAREGLRAMLSHDPQLQVVGEAGDGEGAIKLIRQLQPDIVFVDVRMPGPDGFGVLRAVSTFNRKPAFIFATAYPTRALDAYDADAVDYLLKPFNAARLSRTVQRAIRYLRGTREPATRDVGDERLLLRTPDGAVFVDSGDVTTVTVERNYLRVRTAAADEYVVRQTLAGFARNSRAGFLRISRSTLVNLRRVRAVRRVPAGRFAFEFPDGTSVVSSRRYQRQLRGVIRPT